MNEQLNRRLAFLGILIIGLFAALFTRAWYLQVLTADELSEKARANYVEIVIAEPTRGRILDRHGVVLADNIRSGVITVNQSRYAPGQIDFVLEQISTLTEIPIETLKSRLENQQTHPLAAKVVATGLDEYGLLRVSELSLPGVEAKWEMSRIYPQNEIGAHVVGYVGAMSRGQEDRLLQMGYLPSERVGKSGIEQIFEGDLHGKPGRTELEVDSTGRVHRILSQTDPTPGSDIYLSIDADLQAATESYLRQGLIAARKTVSDDSGFFYPAIGGAAVVMDLRNGDVLAMASHPTYDPNWLVGGITALEYQSVFENPYAPGALNNRAIQGLYSPGSVFKLVTALAGLEARLISPRAAFYDVGYFQIPDKYGCTGRCTFYNADKAPLGIVDLSSAITRSSDAYFYQVAHDLYWIRGDEQWAIQDMAKLLGFGSQTGIQLPFEKSGRIGDGDVKEALFESNPDAYNPYGESTQWLPGDNINTGIGQGFVSVTAIQLANAYAAFANGGTLFSPNIVEKVVARSEDRFGSSVIDFDPRIQRIAEFPEGSGVVREGLHGVTSKARRGTAWRAFEGYDSSGYAIAGKTGTAQAEGKNPVLQRKKEDSAVFVAWAPRHDPRYVVAVVMEEAGFGGEAAAPVARRILEAVRAYEQRWPDPQVAFIPPRPECPEIPEALRGYDAFTSYVPEGCPWGIQVPRANNPEDVDGDGVPDLEERSQ
ncbi:MAG TPA: penicillin-binding protein 2 [Acidimicrobiaceae bacterium]|nr:penicillin-binding protein 2 [Acidimicrobiaceae bacterium]|tara:strand:- start:10103 stop:12235 length:2133 start_codon:yes stop_codon:yes gene_type:complete